MRFKYVKEGFALPSVVVVSIILLGMLALALQLSTTADGALKDQYYNQLAREAAESGVARFRECMRQRIRPILGKKYVPNSRSCQDPSVDPANSAYTMVSGNMRARYEVSLEKSDVNRHSIISVGYVDLLRPSGSVWRTEKYVIRASLSEWDVLTTEFIIPPSYNEVHILRPDGTVWRWGGFSVNGPGGHFYSKDITTPERVIVGVKKMIYGYMTEGSYSPFHYIALKNDGSLWEWGCTKRTKAGQVDCNHNPVRVVASDVKDVFSMYNRTFIVKNDNSVWAWGINTNGSLGNGNNDDTPNPIKIIDASSVGIKKIVGNEKSTFALKDDGSVWSWGRIGDGVGGNTPLQLPTKVPISQAVDIKLTVGSSRIDILMADGRVMWWRYTYGVSASAPQYVSGLQNIQRLYGSSPRTGENYATDSNGALFVWRASAWSPIAPTKIINSGVKDVRFSADPIIVRVGAPTEYSTSKFALKDDGSLFAWGENENCALQNNNKTIVYPNPVQIMTDVKSMHSVEDGGVFAVIKNDNTLWTWGRYPGDGVSSDPYFRCSPFKVMDNVVQVGVSASSTYAIDSERRMWSWGSSYRTLGRGGVGIDKYSPGTIQLPDWRLLY